MPRKAFIWFVVSAALVVTGCGQSPVHVKTATLKDMTALRTYAWYPGGNEIVGLYGDRMQLADETMRKGIDKGMSRKGFRPAADGVPDVLVLYQLGVKSRREVESLKTIQRNGETIAVPDDVTIYRAGTILIYLLDVRANDVVWVGTASAEAKAADSDAAARERVERGVRAVFDAMKKDKST